MRRSSFAGMECSIARTLEVVGEWWTLLVLREESQAVAFPCCADTPLGVRAVAYDVTLRARR